MIATYVTAWLLVFTPAIGEQPITVDRIANLEECTRLAKDMKGERRNPYYICHSYPLVVGGK